MKARILLLAAVQLPTLWRRVDVAGNRRRHPANTEAEKDQQGGLRALAAPDHPCEYQNNRPGDGEASAVDPIVSEKKDMAQKASVTQLYFLLCFLIYSITACFS